MVAYYYAAVTVDQQHIQDLFLGIEFKGQARLNISYCLYNLSLLVTRILKIEYNTHLKFSPYYIIVLLLPS